MPTPPVQRLAAQWFSKRAHDKIKEDVARDLEQVFRALSREAKSRGMKLDRWDGRFSREEEIPHKGFDFNIWMFSVPVRLQHESLVFGVTLGIQDRDYKTVWGFEEVEVEQLEPGDLYFAWSMLPSGVTYDGHPTKKARNGIRWLLNSIEGARLRHRL